jgi:uncharacterized repeat protein (TIGR03803 family)
MDGKQRFSNPLFHIISRTTMAVLAVAILCGLAGSIPPAEAQTYTVIHNFTGAGDGALPLAGVIVDANGSLFGTALIGGEGYGVVFKMSLRDSNWILTPLYAFKGGNDGKYPYAEVIRDASGALYGTTGQGGSSNWGTVFKLISPSPAVPSSVIAPWTESILYNFTNGSDGGWPYSGVVLDQAGNLYGTTFYGGLYDCGSTGCGTVYKVAPLDGGWTESVLHAFTGADGFYPYAGVVFDEAGNLYGTTNNGPNECGNVFQLTPSGSGWTLAVLHSFSVDGDGCGPAGGVIFDKAGNLYGTTTNDGFSWHGTVFELSPFNGNWNFSLLYKFLGDDDYSSNCGIGGPRGPMSSLTMDSTGDLYGTTQGDGNYGWGNVFKLTRSAGGWTYTSLYDFSGGADGGAPCGGVALDASGNLYGTASLGGAYAQGVVWKITP